MDPPASGMATGLWGKECIFSTNTVPGNMHILFYLIEQIFEVDFFNPHPTDKERGSEELSVSSKVTKTVGGS